MLFAFLCYGQKVEKKVQKPLMMYSDSSRLGRPLAKDPFVIHFKGKYLMYYSVPEYKDLNGVSHGWGIGIAESHNLTSWKRIGDVNVDPLAVYESKGMCAPSALVINGTVHLFYQTYGTARKDAICHATSIDGITFTRDVTNPIFHPTGNWNCGRAIDAEVFKFNKNYFLFFATRDSAYQIQMQGVASTPLQTKFHRNEWTQLTDELYMSLDARIPCLFPIATVNLNTLAFFSFSLSANIRDARPCVSTKFTDSLNI
jgi:beta-1,2-mannobiose phosphorylase / 1,2-beta-oligomannan phosphorylase